MCEQKRYGRLILTGTELLVADIFYIATIILGTIPTSGGQLVHLFLKKKKFVYCLAVLLLLCRFIIFRAFVQIDIDLHFVGNKPHLGFIFIFICYLGILTSLDCLDISKYLWSLLYGNRCCFLYYITRVNTAPYFSEVSHKYYMEI